jgi:ketosteroid isomerase-like protein
VLDTSHSAATTVARWRAAGESGDADAAVACLSPDIVLSSPLTEQFRASTAPVHAMVTFGDRRVVPLTRPGARRT